jgi:hypothetical protein
MEEAKRRKEGGREGGREGDLIFVEREGLKVREEVGEADALLLLLRHQGGGNIVEEGGVERGRLEGGREGGREGRERREDEGSFLSGARGKEDEGEGGREGGREGEREAGRLQESKDHERVAWIPTSSPSFSPSSPPPSPPPSLASSLKTPVTPAGTKGAGGAWYGSRDVAW